jgi:hypothetical protein
VGDLSAPGVLVLGVRRRPPRVDGGDGGLDLSDDVRVGSREVVVGRDEDPVLA